MALRPVIFSFLLIFATSKCCAHWSREGIGHVTRVVRLSHAPHVIVASEKGIIARLVLNDLSTGKLMFYCLQKYSFNRIYFSVWRAPAINTKDIIESLCVLKTLESPVVLALVRTEHSTLNGVFTVRALDLTNGTILWTATACGFGSTKGDMEGHSASSLSQVVAVRSCNDGSMFQLIDANSGADVTHAFSQSIDLENDVFWHSWKESTGETTPFGALVWSGFGKDTQKDGKDVQLLSKPNGQLALRAEGAWEDHLTRDEGWAHSVTGTFVSSDHRYGGVPDILVTFSEYGTLFGFDINNEGRQLWVHDVDLNDSSLSKRNCTLVKGHAYHISVVCINELEDGSGHTAVAVVDGVTGGGLMSVHVHPFLAVHAFVHSQCCSATDTCVHLIDRNGDERLVSTCDDSYVAKRNWTDVNPMYLSVPKDGDRVEGIRAGRVMWRFQLPPDMNVVQLALARRSHPSSRSAMKSPVRVTHDRHLLHKFTDSSTVLVIISPRDARVHELKALVIDGISGAVLKAIKHVNATAPISSVRSDNWMIYSFWNSFMLQQELHVIDMYNPRTNTSFVMEKVRLLISDIVSPALRLAGINLPSLLRIKTELVEGKGYQDGNEEVNTEQCETRLSRFIQHPPEPDLLHLSFLLSHQVLHMDVSDTEGAIAERSVLLGLASGQVVSLSRLSLDARRSIGGGMNTAESLMPYYPYISFLPSQGEGEFITRDHYLSGVAGIAVAPEPNQESQCHVAVFGVDMFYNKITPAGRFDMLPEEFRFDVVVASLLFLGIAALYSERALESKELCDAW